MVPAASLGSSPEQMPSPPMNLALMPSCFIWRIIGPATASMPPKKTMSGFLAFRLVRMAVKSVALSLVNSRPDGLAAGGLDGLLEFVGHALAVGGAVVDDGDALALELRHGVLAERAAEVHVIGHHAEGGLVALARVLRVGGRRADLRDAGVAVDLGRRDRGARVQVADDAVDLAVDQLLRGRRALLRVAGVVFGQQFELGLLAADRHALGVELVDGHAGADSRCPCPGGRSCRWSGRRGRS